MNNGSNNIWLDFIQLAEFDRASRKDVTGLIFDEDIPRRERASDTLEKVKYIPEPVKVALDAAIGEIELAEMKPVYILLRETGWRGTDILNLRYDQCLDYVWNSRDEEYVPYLYDEITKTGIPLHKIPIRPEVAEMVAGLIAEAKEKSTDDNNPDKYLFNTYDGKCKGLPYSRPAFAASVNELIARKGIRDGSGEIYHFKTHSLRHTRAMEYTEQGMPIGIIQQILGHCSLQMTLHYSKVSEDMLYKKCSETEKLELFKPEPVPPEKNYPHTEEVCYEHVFGRKWMADNTKNLEAGWKKRSDDARKKAIKAVERIKSRQGQRHTAINMIKHQNQKDVVIESKDKYIAKLQAENESLRKEINQLRAMIYEKK